MFENYKVYETTIAGRPFKLETGKMAQLANASVMATYGETVVLCNVTASAKPREGVDFFPEGSAKTLKEKKEEKLLKAQKVEETVEKEDKNG